MGRNHLVFLSQLEFEPEKSDSITRVLSRWIWRFSNEDRSVWKKCVAQKYGLMNHLTTKEVKTAHGCIYGKLLEGSGMTAVII